MKTKQATHTPTPWNMKPGTWVIVGTDKIGVCEMQRTGNPGQAGANAAFIVRAVNSHEELLRALKDAVANMDSYYETVEAEIGLSDDPLLRYRQAIAKVEDSPVVWRAEGK